MGTFVFKWEHPAQEVYVTGTFDNWSKSEKLEKVGDIFVKDVTLSSAAEKIYYKFVVDGNWVTDHTAPQENDESGNLNNVLTTERIVKHTPATVGIMSTVGPSATTVGLAGDVPLEKAPLEPTGSSDLPGAFPETPAAVEKGDFSVNPLPAFDGAINPIKLAPGEKVPGPSTLTSNTVTSAVKDDPELVAADKAKGESEPTFGVSPLPAFAGAVNPVKVAPGEKIPEPSTVTANTVTSSVTLDKESYENSGGLGNAPTLPPVVTPQSERDQNGTGVFDLPPISKNLIPESSLPMGDAGVGSYDASPLVQSVGAGSTTAQLAAAVPLESSKVPEVVRQSQEEAGFAPEASAVPEEVQEKSAVEKELLGEVKEAPATSEGTGGKTTADKSEEAAARLTTPEPSQPIESRDVSPGTIPGSHTQNQTVPTVVSGAATGSAAPVTPAKDAPATPAKSTPGSNKVDSPAGSAIDDKKKKNRRSFFGKIKEKLSSKKD